MERIIAYVDGHCLHHGLKSKGWKRYYWLNVHKLAQNLIEPGQELVATKYFTSRILISPGARSRQTVYLDALEIVEHLPIILGKFEMRPCRCQRCRNDQSKDPEEIQIEKETDVNLSLEIASDASLSRYDKAILISGDGDLAPAVRMVIGSFPPKKVVVAFPPDRFSFALKDAATSTFRIGRRNIAKSQLPLEIPTPNGYILKRPIEWQS